MPLEPIRRGDFVDADRAAVQDEVIRAVEGNPDAFIERYKDHPDSLGGRYVCADLFKETFEQFSASPEARNRYNTPVHNAAAVLAAEQYRRAIADDSEPERDTAIFLTGIPGAGKTSFVLQDGDVPSNARVVYEGQLAKPETTIPKLQQAIDAGVKPIILVVHAPPEMALENTFRRFNEEGRGASIGVMASIQAGLPACLHQVHQHFGEAVQLHVIDRRDKFHAKALEGWHHLQVLESEGNHEQIKHRLGSALDHHRAAGTISDACYAQAAGLAPLGPNQGLDSEGDRRFGQDGQRRDVPEEGRPGAALRVADRLTPGEQALVVGELRNDAMKRLEALGKAPGQARQDHPAERPVHAQGQKPGRGVRR